MDIDGLLLTYIGGPTALLEIAGLRFLTDPTFDPAGSDYTTPVYTLRKTTSPAIAAGAIGHVDAVLLSHDHHFDNLDRAGRALLPSAGKVLTTTAVTGFLITDSDSPAAPAVYVSGDTVWYDGLKPIASRADVRVALLFLGAAKVREVGPAPTRGSRVDRPAVPICAASSQSVHLFPF